MKLEDLIISSMLEADPSSTNVIQPDVDDIVDSKKVDEALNAVDKYYSMSKSHIAGIEPEYGGRNPMKSWAYEKDRYKNYSNFHIQASALVTSMQDYGNDIGLPIKNGIYDPQAFVNWYETRNNKLGEHKKTF